MQPDDEDMDSDVRELLTGIVVVVENHKTGIKGAAEVWLPKHDEVSLNGYCDVTERYARQIGKYYCFILLYHCEFEI